MNVFFNTPYFLLFIVGTVNSISLFIFDLFAYYFDKDISGVIIGFEKNITSVANIFEFLLDILVNSMWSLGIWLTIYYFNKKLRI